MSLIFEQKSQFAEGLQEIKLYKEKDIYRIFVRNECGHQSDIYLNKEDFLLFAQNIERQIRK